MVECAHEEMMLEGLYEKNALTKMIKYLLIDCLGLCVRPFGSLNADGDIGPLFEEFPKMILLISVGNKPNIVRACIFLLAELLHLKTYRPDILIMIFSNGTKLNELLIEFANSCLAREVTAKQIMDFQHLRDGSIAVDKKRKDMKEIKEVSEVGLFVIGYFFCRIINSY